MTPARDLTARLRAAGLRADRAFDARSPKAQFKAADRSGARLALVVGPTRPPTGKVGIKDLVAGGEQVAVPVDEVAAEVRARLAAADSCGSWWGMSNVMGALGALYALW